MKLTALTLAAAMAATSASADYVMVVDHYDLSGNRFNEQFQLFEAPGDTCGAHYNHHLKTPIFEGFEVTLTWQDGGTWHWVIRANTGVMYFRCRQYEDVEIYGDPVYGGSYDDQSESNQ